MSRDFALSEVTTTIRLALIGGGLDLKEAHDLVTAYTAMQPLMTLTMLATDILSSLAFGPSDNTDEVAA